MTFKGIDRVDGRWMILPIGGLWYLRRATLLLSYQLISLIASVDGLICQLQTNNKFFTLLLHLHFTLLYQ